MNLFKYLKSTLVVFVAFSFFAIAPLVSASTYTFGMQGNGQYAGSYLSGVYELSQTSFLPNVNFTAWGSVQATPSNPQSQTTSFSMTAQIWAVNSSNTYGSIVSLIPNTNLSLNGNYPSSLSGGNTLTAPSTPGDYVVHFVSTAYNGQTHMINMAFTVLPQSPTATTVTVTASPSQVNSGGTATIYWTSTNATYCNTYGHGNATSGYFSTAPLTASTNYLITCSGTTTASASASVEVLPNTGIDLNFGAVPTEVNAGGTSTLSWESVGADICTLSGGSPNTYGAGISGSVVSYPISLATIFNVDCEKYAQTIPGSCLGTYQSTSSVCSGLLGGNTCGLTGDCSQFTAAGCLTPSDPWCHHACHVTQANATESCEGLSQASCSSHATCTWVSGSTVPGATANANVTVNVTTPEPVVDEMVFFDNNARTITIPSGTTTRLKWRTTGFSNNAHCDVFNADGTPVEDTSPYPGPFPLIKKEVNKIGGIEIEKQYASNNFKIECYEGATNPGSGTYTDSQGKSYLSIGSLNMPDLTINSYINTTIATIGVSETFSTVVLNQGDAETGAVGENFNNFFQITTINPNAGGISYNGKGNFLKSFFYKIANAAGLDTGDFPVNTLDSLPAGGSGVISLDHEFSSGGIYYMRGCADKSGSTNLGKVDESNEGNNCGPWTTVTVLTPGVNPDLTINTNANPTVATKGVSQQLTSLVKNIGAKETGAAGTKFWNFFQVTQTDPNANGGGGSGTAQVKKDNYFTSLFYKKANAATSGGGGGAVITNLAATQMNRLLPLGSDTTTADYTFTNTGLYYIRACADKTSPTNLGTVTETNEWNNCGPWTTVTVNLPGTHPDLTITSPATPTTATPGNLTTLSSLVKNIGEKETGAVGTKFWNFFQVSTVNQNMNGGGLSGGGISMNDNAKSNSVSSFFIKKANAASGGTTGITNLAAKQMNRLPAGGSDTTTAVYNFATSGVYYIRACADKTSPTNAGTVTETNETNNCGPWTTVVVGNSGNPDLTAGSITPTTAVVNETTTFSATISNIGTVSTMIGFSNLIQVSLNGTDISDLAAMSMGPLAAGANDTISKSYRFTKTGTYFVRACADKSSSLDNGKIPESNENNNCGGWTTILVADEVIGLCTDKEALNFGLPGPCVTDKTLCINPSATNYLEKLPCIIPPELICKDEKATNYGQVGICVYPDPENTCLDSNATNYGFPLPCTYTGGDICKNPEATNYGQPVPCVLPLCNDPKATNYGLPLPCTMETGVCLDPTATNYTQVGSCIWENCNIDKKKGEKETGIDCGGPDCPTCVKKKPKFIER